MRVLTFFLSAEGNFGRVTETFGTYGLFTDGTLTVFLLRDGVVTFGIFGTFDLRSDGVVTFGTLGTLMLRLLLRVVPLLLRVNFFTAVEASSAFLSKRLAASFLIALTSNYALAVANTNKATHIYLNIGNLIILFYFFET